MHNHSRSHLENLPTLFLLFFLYLSASVALAQPADNTLGESLLCPPYCGFKTRTFQTRGKQLFDPCGQPVVLKGVNKMVFFDPADPEGVLCFAQIAQTKANCVRISWQMKNDHDSSTTDVNRLDRIITNAEKNFLIPIIGLWDYTGADDGGFAHLKEYADYWTSPAVMAVIRKHQSGLIINIANEAATGDEYNPVDLDMFAVTYNRVVRQMRRAGIQTPLMIDGMDRGKSLHCFAVKGPGMLPADSLHNLIFSVHPYWPKAETDTMEGGQFVRHKFDEIRPLAINIILGEINKYGARPDTTRNPCTTDGLVDYEQFMQQVVAQNMHWLIWEWGPGNAIYFKDGRVKFPCPNMDMTTNRLYASLKSIPNTTAPVDINDRYWMKYLALDAPYSIQKTAQKTFFINSGLKTCPHD